MSNLLPQEQKKVLKKEYILKLAIVGNVLFSIVIVTALILLGTFWLRLWNEENVLKQNIKLLNLNTDEKAQSEIVKNVNSQIKTLQIKTHILSSTDALRLVLKNKNRGIKIFNIEFNNTILGGKINISGNADTRENLIAFIQNLEKEKIIKMADSPISNLSKNNNIQFNIIITLANNEKEK